MHNLSVQFISENILSPFMKFLYIANKIILIFHPPQILIIKAYCLEQLLSASG